MSHRNIPVVPRWKVLMNIRRFLKNPIPILNKSLAEYGDTYITFLGGSTRTFITIDPGLIKHVLQKNHTNYEKSKIQTDDLAKYIGKGLLTTNGSYWLRQRRLIQPGFHKKKLMSLVDIMNTEITDYCEELTKRIKDNPIVNMSEEMTQLTLRVVTKSLFSTGIDRKMMEHIGKNITEIQRAIVKDVRQPFLKWYRKLSGYEKRSLNLAQNTQSLLADIIALRKQSGPHDEDLLDMLLSARYEDTGEPMTDQQVLEESLVLFVAGHETSSNAMTWMHYLLHQNPNEKSNILDEIDQTDFELPNFDQALSLTNISNAVSESMRLYPPAWITDRVALDDDDFEGIAVKKGDVVAPYIYGAHIDQKRWANADQFIPDRFSKQNQKSRESYSYFPFGGGPRLCIGQQFALIEMQLIAYHMYKRFDFKLIPDQTIEMEPLVTLRPKNGIEMKVQLK